MNLNDKTFPSSIGNGLSKFEYTAIEFMKSMLVDIEPLEITQTEEDFLQIRAEFAIKAARIIADILRFEE